MSNSGREKLTNKTIESRHRTENREQALRADRVPIHKQEAIVFKDQDPNFRYRLVADKYGRIDRFLKAGWSIVEGDSQSTFSGKGRSIEAQRGSQIWRVMNEADNATFRDGALMRIPIEYYNEDQMAKMDAIDSKMEQIDPTGQLDVLNKLGSIQQRQKDSKSQIYIKNR